MDINDICLYDLECYQNLYPLISKVNDSLITELRILDSILPVGRGQRQLILGDGYSRTIRQ